MKEFAAVILAGGKSSRMRRDKAWLEFGGQPLLARQIALARQIGAAEILISGRAGVDYSAFDFPVLEDHAPHSGPLAGIAAALTAARHPLLLVLAVDMPHLTGGLLNQLYAVCHNGSGAIPRHHDIVEPLAAFYPKLAIPLLQKLLSNPDQSYSPGAKLFAVSCIQAGLARYAAVASADAERFRSWNSPADLLAG